MSLRGGAYAQLIKDTQEGFSSIFRAGCFYFDLEGSRAIGVGHLIALKKAAFMQPMAPECVQVADWLQFNLPIMLQD